MVYFFKIFYEKLTLLLVLQKIKYLVMRKTIFIISIILWVFIASCTSQKNNTAFNLTFNIKNGKNSTVFLTKAENGVLVNKDSVQLVNGRGFFTGNVDFPEIYYINIKGTRVYIPVFVEKGDVFVEADVDDPKKPDCFRF